MNFAVTRESRRFLPLSVICVNDLPSRLLARVVALRAPILILYALLTPLAAWKAAHISSENGLERLIQPGDPDFIATRAFQKIFPDRPSVLLVFESPDPWSAASLARLDAAAQAIRAVPHVSAFSALDAARRAAGDEPRRLRALIEGTPFFRKQGLVGPDYLSLATDLDVRTPAERDAALDGIDRALESLQAGRVRKVGAPYAQRWIEEQSGRAATHYFPFFGGLIVVAALALYRSIRTLLAFLFTLAATVALAVAAGGLLGYRFTIVSVLVPLTILVTALASLVYLHSRFVEQPEGVPIREHQLAALRNKLLPVTASMAAAALGFAALYVSKIQPLRELGIWTAMGLVIAWIVAFTLFPALQLALRTPTRAPEPRARSAGIGAKAPPAAPGGDLYDRLTAGIPAFSSRHRGLLVGGALFVSLLGGVALFGIPGKLAPMTASVDTVTYIDPQLPLRQDLDWFREHVGDLNVAHVWVHLPKPIATGPDTLRALDALQRALEQQPRVLTVIGPTTFLRLRRYFAGQPEAIPEDAASLQRASEELEQLLMSEPSLRGYIDVASLGDLNLTVIFEQGDAQGYAQLEREAGESFTQILNNFPGMAGAEVKLVGEQRLQSKVGDSLVPTLAESFAITAALIFVVFLFVFRSGTARLMAMIPSLFAILATFLGMRIFGAPLNVATILIATTVLGTTETDQVHFFHHLNERSDAPLAEALAHSLRVSGRAMVFATAINAAGFFALSFSSFPPLRQFGLVTSAAFLLALLADFTALPAGLWIIDRFRRTPAARTAVARNA